MANQIFQTSPSGSGLVTVLAGSQQLYFPAGRTVDEYRRLASEVAPIASDAVARRNNQEVAGNTVLNANETLSFMRNTGQKGNR